jgi:hypothetical protein
MLPFAFRLAAEALSLSLFVFAVTVWAVALGG